MKVTRGPERSVGRGNWRSMRRFALGWEGRVGWCPGNWLAMVVRLRGSKTSSKAADTQEKNSKIRHLKDKR